MKKILLVALAACAHGFAYPRAPHADVVDDYFGTKVADPWRPLEEDSPRTRAWIDAENRLTERFLGKLPRRERLRERIDALARYETWSLPVREGARWFWTHQDGAQDHAVLLFADSPDAPPRVLLDPNGLAADHSIALAGWSPSQDGSLVAYGLGDSGSDWITWHVRDVATGRDLPDQIAWTHYTSPSWTADGKGFYYTGYDEPKGAETVRFPKIRYHVLGTAQAADTVVYERPDQPDWSFGAWVTDDGKWLVFQTYRGTEAKNLLSVRSLGRWPKQTELVTDFQAEFDVVGNKGAVFYVRTNLDAPRFRLLAINLAMPDRAHWKEVVPEGDATLTSASLVGDRLLADYLVDAHSEAKVFDLVGKPLGAVALPGIGTTAGFAGRRDDSEAFFAYTSFTAPPSVWRWDVATGTARLWRAPRVDFDPSAFETRQLFLPAKDGARLSVFVTAKKGVVGPLPLWLYGYGGFDISMTPAYSGSAIAWMELGGAYAVAVIRGGGEYGEAWHEGGMLAHKQTVFDDFIAIAEFLIAQGWTTPAKLAISGGSNGGLLVGACLTQRPELFGAASPDVGVLDMLRYDRFTVGWNWRTEYGSASTDASTFRTLVAYSPLHRIVPGTHYPPTLVTTGDHDDRVIPAHSFKFAAALQAAQGGRAPILLRVDRKAGHHGGTRTKAIELAADRLAFFAAALGL